jgi:hypothetical protein
MKSNSEKALDRIAKCIARIHEATGMRIPQIIYNATSGLDFFYWSDVEFAERLENFESEMGGFNA